MNKNKNAQKLQEQIDCIVRNARFAMIRIANPLFAHKLLCVFEHPDKEHLEQLSNEYVNGSDESLHMIINYSADELMKFFNKHKFEYIDVYTNHNNTLSNKEDKAVINDTKKAYSRYKYLSKQLDKVMKN